MNERIKQAIRQYTERNGLKTFHPRAVLFDMDGVLYDSMPRHARAWHEAMQKFGIDMPEYEAFRVEGMRGVEICQIKAREQLHREITEDEAERMYQEKAKHFASYGDPLKMESVEELMRKMKADGMRIGVVTGSGQRPLIQRLCHDFEGLIESPFIVTSYDVTRGKPEPEPYLKGLEKVGVAATEAIVVENAPLGVRAAVAANIFTVAVNTGPLPEQMLTDEHADLVFERMADFCEAWDNFSTNNELI